MAKYRKNGESASTERMSPEIADGAVGQVLAEVIPLLRQAGRQGEMVVLVQRRHELMRLAAVEAVPALEAAPARPRPAGRGHVRLVLRGEVPFAHGHRDVAAGRQDLRQEPVAPRDVARVAGEPDGQVGDASHAVGMVIAPGQQAGAGR